MTSRTVKRAALVVVLVVAGLIVLLLTVAHAPWTRNYLLARLREEARAAGMSLDIDSLSYNIPAGSADIEGVTLRRAAPSGLPPVLTARRIRLKAGMRRLILGQRLEIDSGSVDGLAIHIVRFEDGRTNLPESKSQSTTNDLPDFLVSAFTATGSLRVEDRVSRFDVTIPEWKLNLAGTALPLQHHLRFDLARSGTLLYQGRPQSLDALSLDAHFDRRNATIQHLRVVTAQSGVTISGNLVGFGQPVVDLNTAVRLDLRPLLLFAGRPDLAQEVQGTLLVNGRVRDRIESPAVDVDLTSRDVVATRAGSVDLTAAAGWTGATGVLELKSAQVRTADATLGLRATWSGTTPQSQNRASVHLQRADLLALSRRFGIGSPVASTASGSLEARWSGTQYDAAAGNLSLNLSGSRDKPSPGVLPLSGTVTAAGGRHRFQLEAREVQTLGSKTQASVQVDADRVSGVVEGRTGDLGLLLPELSAFLGERGASLRNQKASGSASAKARLGGTLSRPTASVALEGTDIGYGPLEGVQVSAEAEYQPAGVSVTRARMAWKQSEIEASGRVGLEGSRPISFQAQSNSVAIGEVLGALGSPAPVSGTVTATASGEGTLDDPRAQIEVRGEGIVAYGEPLGNLNGRASYANGTLEVPSLNLQKRDNGGTFEASGSLRTASRAYSVNLQAKAFAVRNLVLPGGQTLRGDVDLSAAGTGTFDSPALKLHAGVRDAEAAGHKLGAVTADLTVANRQAVLAAEVPELRATVEGTAQLQAPYPLTLRAHLQNTDLAKVPGAPSGSITADFQGSGEIENWRKGEAAVEVSSVRVETPAGAVTNDGPIRAGYRNGAVEVASARLTAPNSSLTIEGRLPLEATSPAGTLTYAGTFDLVALQPWIAQQSGLTVSGGAEVKGSITGTLARLQPAAQLTLSNGSVRSAGWRNPVENIRADITLHEGTVSVRTLEAQAGAGRLTATGTVPLGLFPVPAAIAVTGPAVPAKFTLQATGFRIESILNVPESVRSDIGLRVEISADKPDLRSVTGTATFDRLQLDLAGIQLVPDAPPRLSLRNGIASIDHFSLQGNTATIQAGGSLDLPSKELRNVNLEGRFDAALLSSFSRDAAATGTVNLQVAAKGTLNDPQMAGHLEWTDGQIGLSRPAVQASDMQVRIGLANNEVRIERFQGDLNGGPLTASGSFRIANGTIQNPQLEVNASNVYLDFPEGLQTRSTAKIRLVPQGEFYVLDGTVKVEEGSYTRSLDLQTQLLQYLRNRGGIELSGDRDPFLSRLRYNIAIEARDPVVMDNNLGELALTADLRLLGTYYRPGLAGRIQIEEGGTLRLQENKYTIEQGTISFVNETRIEPSIDLTARTQVANREIGMRIYSEREGIQTDLTSDNPEDTRADIMALLLTGRTAEKLEGRELSVIGEQAGMALLAGSVTGRVSEQLTNTLGLSSVRLEPSLISAEKNPTARLTIGQDIATGLEFIYSMDLTNSSDQIYIVDYELTRRFNTRGTRQDDNTYRFDLQHDLRFGGPPVEARKRTAARTVGSVRFSGELVFPEATLADRLGIKSGNRFDFFKMRKGLESIGSLYRKNGYLEAKVRLRPRQDESTVDFQVHVEAGPTVEFAFESWNPPGRLREAVAELWSRGAFDTQRLARSIEAIRGTLARDGYLQPSIDTSVRIPELGRKTVTFEVIPATRYRNVKLAFDGAGGIAAKTIEQRIEQAKLKDAIATDPEQVRDFIARYYRQEGYLDAQVNGPEYDRNEGTGEGRIRFTIREGQRYRLGEVRFQGASAIEAPVLETSSGIRKGDFYSPQALEDSRSRIEEEYWALGYRDVTLDYRLEKKQSAGTVDLTIAVEENQQSVVQEVRVAGNHVTSESFARRQVALTQGDVLNFRRTARSRRNLYATGAFTSVDLREEAIPQDGAPGAVKPVRLIAEVRERTPFQFRYGAFFDTERGPGFIADLSNRNSLGGGRLIGLRTRYDADVREARLYFSQPLLRQLPFKTDATLFRRRELREAFITDRTGATFQQLVRMRDRFELTYGYRIENAHTFDRNPDEFLPFDDSLRIAPLTATLSRDTRDEVLDATRGSFNSQALEFSTATLGSDLRFMRYFGQYFRYFGLTRPAPVPFKGAVEVPRVIFATGVRVGLAHGFGGQEVIRSERFFAGGGTTVRGFGQDELGPVDFLGQPDGGNAMLLINNELRFPLFRWFEGVSFVDAGNVYSTVGDFRFKDLRTTGGVGLRLRTPYFLLRADYGAKFSPRPGESRGAWFFSIGQAF